METSVIPCPWYAHCTRIVVASPVPVSQGLTLVHFLVGRQHFLWGTFGLLGAFSDKTRLRLSR